METKPYASIENARVLQTPGASRPLEEIKVITVQITTKPGVGSSWREYEAVKAALETIGIEHEDLYPTPRPGVWQVEVYGNAHRTAMKMDKSPEISTLRFCQDEIDGQPFALILFRLIAVDDAETAAFYDRADVEFDERR